MAPAAGSVVPRLVDALGGAAPRLHAVVFFTYLYYPTYWGLGTAAAAHSVLVPTTHDEPPLRFAHLRRGLRASSRAGLPHPGGGGPGARAVRSRRTARHGGRDGGGRARRLPTPRPSAASTTSERPYALYAGRIDAGKGCAELVAHYARYRARGGTADLLLIGTLAMDLPPVPGLRHLGYLSEEDKHAALAAASVVVCPSPYESLSIALLEGFAVDTPGLVNGASAVLKEHCLRSNGAPLLRRRRRVRGGAGPPGDRRGPAAGPGREREALRRGELSLGRGARPLPHAHRGRRAPVATS